MRHDCAIAPPHSQGFSLPHSHMLRCIGRPVAFIAADMLPYASRACTVISVVSQQDHIIPAPLQMLFAQQMHSTVVPVEAGHLAMLIAPEETAKAIIAAANSY